MIDKAKSEKKRLSAYTDAQLSSLIKEGNSDAFVELTARYVELIRAKSAPFHGTFLDHDDFYQEGLWGLYTAACTYRTDKGSRFSTYASICIHNRILMAYRNAKCGRNQPLDGFVSLNEEINLSASDTANPEAQYLSKERLQQVHFAIQNMLTEMEQKTLHLF